MDNLRLWGESKLFGQVCEASSDLGSPNQAWLFFPPILPLHSQFWCHPHLTIPQHICLTFPHSFSC